MTYFHSFWTRPIQPTADGTGLQEIEIWDFEALTWLTSALEIRRHSPIRLLTDSRGLRFVRNVGLEWVYNAGISTELDHVPQTINPQVFWTAGKVYSYLLVQTPCVSVDTDAVLWRELAPTGPVMALHAEYTQWPWYASNQQCYGPLGFAGPDWDWQLPPFNAAVVYFEGAEMAHYYAQTALGFMMEFSRQPRPQPPPRTDEPAHRSDPLLFAEQRLLPMCAKRMGLNVTAIGVLDSTGEHLVKNSGCMHLWGTKLAYKRCAEARTAYLNFLIRRLRRQYPESIPTLRNWKLDRPRPADPTPSADGQAGAPLDQHARKFSLLGNVNGVVWIEDSNVPVRRAAKKGSWLLPGEILWPEAGAAYELIAPSGAVLKLQQR